MRAKTAVRPVLSEFVCTGQRRDRHYRIDMDGQAVWLPLASFGVFVQLMCAAIRSESGLAQIERSAVHRLRKAIDTVFGRGAAKQLIVTGAGEEYRLAIRRAKIYRHVGVTPCFAELLALDAVSNEQSECLLKHCGKRRLRETDE